MKAETPIKRHQTIASFSRDHHFGLLLAWKIRQGLIDAVSPERISNYVIYFFDKDLKKHFREEEELLFSKLPADNIFRQRGESGHKSILQLLIEIEKDKVNSTILTKLANALEAHIRFEERELLGYLQAVIPEKELEAIVGRSPNNGQEIDDHWNDAFWKPQKNTKWKFPSNITRKELLL